MSLRIVFMGTPEFAARSLAQIVIAGHEVVAVYTQPPRPAGRGQALRRSAVHDTAEGLGLTVHTPASLKSKDVQDELAALAPDVIIVVAYGQILPPAVLDIPEHGCLNLHASLLPRWRGAAPIQRAIMAGDTMTGVQIMRMEAGLDTGPIFMTESVPIRPDDTGGSLHDRLADVGANLWFVALAALQRGAAVFTEQSEDGITYAHKITREDRQIDWCMSAEQIRNQVRALAPAPGAFTFLPDGRLLKVLAAAMDSEADSGEPGTLVNDRLGVATGEGVLRLTRIQPEGKAPMDADAFLAGHACPAGQRLGTDA